MLGSLSGRVWVFRSDEASCSGGWCRRLGLASGPSAFLNYIESFLIMPYRFSERSDWRLATELGAILPPTFLMAAKLLLLVPTRSPLPDTRHAPLQVRVSVSFSSE